MKPTWMKEFFRDAEGEGAGGAAGSSSAEGAQPAPDKIDALEARLAKISKSVEGISETRQRDKVESALSLRAGELKRAIDAANADVASKENALAEAYEDGDGVAIARAQRELTQSVNNQARADQNAEQFRAQVEAARKEEAAKPKADKLDDTNLSAWKAKHAEWYGVDAEMTRVAHDVDRQIREAGVLSVGTQEYFNAVDREMNRRYPDRLSGSPSSGNPSSTPPNSRSRGQIQQSIADGWRRMGINMDDPKTVDRMVKNRERLVQKGILPEQPVKGQVVTR